jgi:AbrB family looped-hinge helix DNA binding protein
MCVSVIEGNRETHIYGTVKVGNRGQVVIPVEARKELNINPGDLLLVMAGRNRRGLAMVKADAMRELVDRIMKGLEEGRQEP